MFQFNIVFGILVAFLSNYLLGGIGEHAWRWMLGVAAIPALIYTLMCFTLPESPRWLLTRKNDRDAGMAVLRQIQPQASESQIEAEAAQIVSAAQNDESTSHGFWSARHRIPILLAFLIAFFTRFMQSSSVSLSVVDTIVTAGVVMFSPANTSKKLSTYDDKGLYFRDAPSDILQGQVLADTMIEDGKSNVYILALNDDYGTGLAEDLKAGLEGGGATVIDTKIYDPKAADYSAEVSAAKDSGADAIALIGFDESSKILAKMAEQGIKLSIVYGVDGNMGNALAENFEAGK